MAMPDNVSKCHVGIQFYVDSEPTVKFLRIRLADLS
jgi:hypothetical protein